MKQENSIVALSPNSNVESILSDEESWNLVSQYVKDVLQKKMTKFDRQIENSKI